MTTFWAPFSRHAWIHPPLHSTTPSYNTAFIHLATSNFQLVTVWCSNSHVFNVIWWLLFSHGFILGENAVQPWSRWGCVDGIFAQHLMLGSCYQEKWWDRVKISLFHTHIPLEILVFPHWGFPPLFLWRRVTEDASVSFSSSSGVMASRCLHHTFQQWAPVPAIQVVYCLQMRGNGGVRAASCQDQVLPVLRSGQASVGLI